jgi:hypothetical protein
MSSSNPQITISLWRPLHLRIWRGAVETLRAGALAGVRAWHAHTQRLHRRRVWRELAELNPRVLQDIGAPEWVVLDAGDRSDMARRRLDDLRTWQGL